MSELTFMVMQDVTGYRDGWYSDKDSAEGIKRLLQSQMPDYPWRIISSAGGWFPIGDRLWHYYIMNPEVCPDGMNNGQEIDVPPKGFTRTPPEMWDD